MKTIVLNNQELIVITGRGIAGMVQFERLTKKREPESFEDEIKMLYAFLRAYKALTPHNESPQWRRL